MAYSQDAPAEQPDPSAPSNWWEGPPPAGYSGPWPPPLPPGGSYGPNFGQIVYAPGSTQPPDTTAHPEYWGNGTQAPDPTPPQPPLPGPPTPRPPQGAPQSGSQQAPSFNAPGYTPPPAFSYADFVAPSPDDLNNDPVYQNTLRTEQDAIQKSAAARGILNTGGTINDLLLNANNVASTGYHDLWSRNARDYSMNRQNAVDKYNINYGTQYADPYKFSYQGAQDTYNSNIHNFDLNRQYGWYGTLLDFQKDQDAFDRKYRLLSI